MAVVSERVNVMKQEFMTLHEKGYSIPEIARRSNLSSTTIYLHLQEIADANGVERSELLQRVRAKLEERIPKDEEERVKCDIEALMQGFADADVAITKIVEKINKILEEKEHEANE